MLMRVRVCDVRDHDHPNPQLDVDVDVDDAPSPRRHLPWAGIGPERRSVKLEEGLGEL